MKGNRGAGAATPDACVRFQNLYSHCSCVAAEEEDEDEDTRSKGILMHKNIVRYIICSCFCLSYGKFRVIGCHVTRVLARFMKRFWQL